MREALQRDRVTLPSPRLEGGAALEQAIRDRRSRRRFAPRPLEVWQIGQLLWATQGLTEPGGLRAAPSAGATYPLELYLACAEGVFHYQPGDHTLVRITGEDRRPALARAALGQAFVAAADVVLVFAALPGRTTARYRERGVRYVHMEVGHAAQNTLLQAAALGLGAVPVGAFDDAALAAAAALPAGQQALYLVPVGWPA